MRLAVSAETSNPQTRTPVLSTPFHNFTHVS